MAYTIVEPDAGFTAIAAIDSGISKPVSVSDGTTTTIPTPPNQLGAIVRAVDPVADVGAVGQCLEAVQESRRHIQVLKGLVVQQE